MMAGKGHAVDDLTEQRDLQAGDFSSWLRRTRTALLEEGGADVPCGDCSACCASSHFVHIRPEEERTLARIPRALLFAAPGWPDGHVLLGYDDDGRCPMLAGGGCSIYEHRPLTCRAYDCRVFAAAGIAADRELITRRTRRWKFGHPTQGDRDRHAAVRAAAGFLRGRAACFPGGAAPSDPAQVAVLAVKVSDVFLAPRRAPGAAPDGPGGEPAGEPGTARSAASDAEIATAIMEANEHFEARREGRPTESSREGA